MASLLSTESGLPQKEPDALAESEPPKEKLPRRQPVKEEKPEKQRLSRALAQIAQRALEVDPRDVDRMQPRELDVQIAEAFLAGYVTYRGIAQMIDCSEAHVKKALRDPLTCAWVSRTVHRNIGHRLGLIDAAMLQRAMCGDTRAADILYKRYGGIKNVNVNLNANVGSTDFSKLEDEDLEAMVKAARKDDERRRVIDVEVVEEKTEEDL